jgi:hypothetical protein
MSLLVAVIADTREMKSAKRAKRKRKVQSLMRQSFLPDIAGLAAILGLMTICYWRGVV